MTDLDRLRATLAQLRARPDPSGWEERHRDDLEVALAEIDRLHALATALAERVCQQSELLSRRAGGWRSDGGLKQGGGVCGGNAEGDL